MTNNRDALMREVARFSSAQDDAEKQVATEAIHRAADWLPPVRQRMPALRPLRRHELRIGGVRSDYGYSGGAKVFIQVSYYPKGHPWARRPGEVFINFDASYETSDLRHFANGFAMAASLLLQHGVAPAAIAHTFEEIAGGPSGDVDGHETIKSARSVIELVAKLLLEPPPEEPAS